MTAKPRGMGLPYHIDRADRQTFRQESVKDTRILFRGPAWSFLCVFFWLKALKDSGIPLNGGYFRFKHTNSPPPVSQSINDKLSCYYLLGSGHKLGSWRTTPNGKRIGVYKVTKSKGENPSSALGKSVAHLIIPHNKTTFWNEEMLWKQVSEKDVSYLYIFMCLQTAKHLEKQWALSIKPKIPEILVMFSQFKFLCSTNSFASFAPVPGPRVSHPCPMLPLNQFFVTRRRQCDAKQMSS